MICPICFGHRLFYFQGQLLPCPECEGAGEIHCCDGLQAQPESDSSCRFSSEGESAGEAPETHTAELAR